MTTVTTTYIRPSTDVAFYLDQFGDVASAFSAVVNGSAHKPTVVDTLSGDGLTLTSEATFADEAQLNLFLGDLNAQMPTFFDDRNAYCAAVGITIQRTVA